MNVYWIVWISIIILAVFIRQGDYACSGELTASRCVHTKAAKICFVIAGILLVMIAGCRYYVGTDFGAYYRQYRLYVGTNRIVRAFIKLDEPGIRIIYTLASAVHDTPGMCIFAVAAVTLGIELSVIYKNTDMIGAALVLFAFTCWSACFNGVRQDLAAAVLFCGLPALREKNFIKYAIIVFLAFLCHRSAIVMILVYFIVNREVNTKNIILLIAASAVVLVSYDYVFGFVNVVLDHDLTGQEAYWNARVNVLRTASKVAPAVFFMLVYKGKTKTPESNFYLNLLIVHAVVAVVTSNSTALARMSMYTAPFAVIAIVELVKRFPLGIRGLVNMVIAGLYWFMEWYECSKSPALSSFRLKWFW